MCYAEKLKSPRRSRDKFIAGSLECIFGYGTKNIDLGIVDFRSKVKNKQTNIEIMGLGRSFEKEFNQYLYFSFPIPKYQFKSVSLFSTNGKKYESIIKMTYWFNGRQIVECHIKEILPTNGRIIVESYEGLQKYQIPFRIINVPLKKYLSTSNN